MMIEPMWKFETLKYACFNIFPKNMLELSNEMPFYKNIRTEVKKLLRTDLKCIGLVGKLSF